MRWFLLGSGGAVAVAVAIVVGLTQIASPQACAAPVPMAAAASTLVTGTATHYVLPSSGGNCSYPGPPADGLYVALSPSEYDSAAACGGYLEVTGPDGSVRVEVVDLCPPCQAGHIDLSETAFAKLAPLSAGLINVTYRTVADPPLPGQVSLRVKEGSSPYWLALLPMNTGNPVASVEVKSSSRGWQELARASFNYWIASSGMGAGPFTVKITDTLGHAVTVTGIQLDPGVVQATATMMYGPGVQAAAVPPSATPSPSPTRTTRRPPAARTSHSRSIQVTSPTPIASTSMPSPSASPTPSC